MTTKIPTQPGEPGGKSAGMPSPGSSREVTAAVRRGGEAFLVRLDALVEAITLDRETAPVEYVTEVFTSSLTAALDVEEMARAADPKAFEDHPIELRSRPAALHWAVRRKIATDHARAIRDAILGADQ